MADKKPAKKQKNVKQAPVAPMRQQVPAKQIANQVHTLMGFNDEHRTGFVFIDDKYELFVIIKNDYK